MACIVASTAEVTNHPSQLKSHAKERASPPSQSSPTHETIPDSIRGVI